MLFADRGATVAQRQIGLDLQSAQSLSGNMNQFGSGWRGAGLDRNSFAGLNNTGSWGAMMTDGPGSLPHWVVVDGLDNAGMVMIRDPWQATRYTMAPGDFFGNTSGWTGFSVFKP
jgi:hypothetical protein